MTRHVTTTDLRSVFSPDVVDALAQLVDERIQDALADRTRDDGSPWLTLSRSRFTRSTPMPV